MRTLLSVAIAVGLLLELTTWATAAERKAKHAHGTVKSLDGNVLTVEVVKGKKGQQTTSEEKFTLTKDTKFERVTRVKGEKGKTETTPAERGEVVAGAKVSIVTEGGKVQKVALHGKKK